MACKVPKVQKSPKSLGDNQVQMKTDGKIAEGKNLLESEMIGPLPIAALSFNKQVNSVLSNDLLYCLETYLVSSK